MPRIDLHNPSPFAQLLSRLDLSQKEILYENAAQLVSENRRALIDRIAPLRTRHITVALEDVYQSHNAAAVLRSCDCFGIQDVHVVERNNPFNPAGDVAVGSSKWVDYYPYPDIQSAYAELRRRGYRIVATTPHTNDTLITDLDISTPVALIFGTELTGLSKEAIDLADEYVKIPMYGFTESFNISVSVALSLFNLTERLRHSNNQAIKQSNNQAISHSSNQAFKHSSNQAFKHSSNQDLLDLKLHWLAQTIRDGEQVLMKLAGQ